MAPRVSRHRARPPIDRAKPRGYFYAHEAARLLGAPGIDYAQLRRLYRLVRPELRMGAKKWARFRFADLIAMRVAFELAGGVEALRKGRRLRLRSVEAACRSIRKDFGISDPLTQCRMWREGARIVAQLDGVRFEPASGQVRLAFGDLRSEFKALTTVGAGRRDLVARLAIEEKNLRTADARIIAARIHLEVGT